MEVPAVSVAAVAADPVRSRRELLAAAAGGVLALVAGAIGHPPPVRAADGEAVLVGGEYDSTSATRITNSSPRISTAVEGTPAWDSSTAFRGDSPHGIAVHGVSDSYVGVWGHSASVVGVRGTSDSGRAVVGSSSSGAGVVGYSTSGPGVAGQSPTQGVLGSSAAGVAIRAETASGFGVYSQADSGTGLYGRSSTGYALRTSGRLRFDKSSGVATVAAGTKSVVVTPGFELAPTTKVLATLQGSAGGTTTIHRVAVNATAGTFTLYLTANATTAVHVAWLALG
jgi:hypothetical protein